jgi:hypothetical protein
VSVSVYLSEASRITLLQLLSFHDSPVVVRAGFPPFGKLFFDYTRICACVHVWGSPCHPVKLLLSLLGLALRSSARSLSNHMRVCVCVPVWGSSHHLTEAIVISSYSCLSSLSNHMRVGVCAPVWSSSLHLAGNTVISRSSCLFEGWPSAGSLFDHMRVCLRPALFFITCVLYLPEAPPTIRLKLLSSQAPPVNLRAGLRPALFLITCVSVSVYLSGAPPLVWVKVLSSHASPVFLRDGLRPALFLITCVSAFGRLSC